MSNMNKVAAMAWIASALLLAACATAPNEPQTDEHAAHPHNASMAQMHGEMQQMQELMAKIHASKDPAERQRLMAEHRAAMRSQMQMMHGMMSDSACPMMEGGQDKKGGMMGGNKGGMMSKGADQHQCPMMGHMKMMHEMMGQMMAHMSVEHGDQSAVPNKKSDEHIH